MEVGEQLTPATAHVDHVVHTLAVGEPNEG
jgi:hypothetical protein